ncbi:MAG TPA: hypothetical protein VGF99_05030 [Myxococcota bacterium]
MGRAPVIAVLLTLLAGSVLTTSCATTSTSTAARRDARRLRALERSFHEFVATPLPDEASIEDAVARLEALRLDYVDALTAASNDDDRLLALLRLAELHLDLSARIRRVPENGATGEAARALDARLAARALPLEATGLSVLAQVVEADVGVVDDDVSDVARFVRRARLYLHLHTDAPLTEADLDVLREELVAVRFRAPRSLLDVGRIGQRAARR